MTGSIERRGSALAAIGAAIGFALSIGSSPGCVQSVFTCGEDANCLTHGEGGVCEANNLCTFPDETCPTGRRWHSRAGDLASECVEDESAATGTGSGTSGTGGSSEEGGDESTTGNGTTPLTSGDSSSGAPPPPPPDTTTEPADSGSGSGMATTGAPSMCDAQFGGAPDYLYCSETVDSCTFSVTTGMVDSCNVVCTNFGGTCLEQHSNDVDLCTSTGATTCDDIASNDVICVCSIM